MKKLLLGLGAATAAIAPIAAVVACGDTNEGVKSSADYDAKTNTLTVTLNKAAKDELITKLSGSIKNETDLFKVVKTMKEQMKNISDADFAKLKFKLNFDGKDFTLDFAKNGTKTFNDYTNMLNGKNISGANKVAHTLTNKMGDIKKDFKSADIKDEGFALRMLVAFATQKLGFHAATADPATGSNIVGVDYSASWDIKDKKVIINKNSAMHKSWFYLK